MANRILRLHRAAAAKEVETALVRVRRAQGPVNPAVLAAVSMRSVYRAGLARRRRIGTVAPCTGAVIVRTKPRAIPTSCDVRTCAQNDRTNHD